MTNPALLLIALTSFGAQDELPARVTFAEHIAPLVYANCSSCHRPGEAAPFPLLSYEDVSKRAGMIDLVVGSRRMPPWHPEEGFGHFKGERRLTDREIELFARWAETGAELGDPDAVPPSPEFPSGWPLGEPDLVVETSAAFEVPADGPDIYRNFVIPLDLEEDQWVKAVELRPSARSVVHHCLYFLDESGEARKLDEQDPTPGFRGMGFRRSGDLGGWAVGASARKLPDGLARPLPKGSDLVLSMHFHPTGKKESEKTQIGLYFAEEPPQKTLVGFMIPNQYGRRAGIDIPPGEKEFIIRDSFVLPVATDLVTASGHAHYLCKSMKATATLEDGTVVPLLSIPEWDFNWQGQYDYRSFVRLPAGAKIDAEIVYDNSAENPANPYDPPRRVKWGLESEDEMGALIFNAVAASEGDAEFLQIVTVARSLGRARSDRGLLGRVRDLDTDGDGILRSSEVPLLFRRFFDRMDANGDDEIDIGRVGGWLDEEWERRRSERRKARRQ